MNKIFTFILLLSSSLNLLIAQTTTDSFLFDNIDREYVLHVPAIYNPADAVPLLISLHGLGDNIANFSGAGFHTLANSENFIVVTPQALDFSFAGFSVGTAWNSGVGALIPALGSTIYPNENINDVGFISALIDSISAIYNIDPDRIYATGFSMGGFMTNRLGVELNERIAAIASVSGTLGDNVSRANVCPIPAMHIHGTGDATVNYYADYTSSGGLYTIAGDSAAGLMNFWNNTDQTDAVPAYNANYATIGSLVVEEFVWSNGLDSSETRHLKINGGDHVWNVPFYPNEIWDFLSIHKNQEICTPVVSGIEDVSANNTISIYPNPCYDELHIASTESIENVKVFNTLGEKVLESTETNIDVSSLEQGIYYLLIQTESAVLKSKISKK